jgi:hypothetical protein
LEISDALRWHDRFEDGENHCGILRDAGAPPNAIS